MDVLVTIPNSHKTKRITAIVYNIFLKVARDLVIIRALDRLFGQRRLQSKRCFNGIR